MAGHRERYTSLMLRVDHVTGVMCVRERERECVCVCVCLRALERERDRERERQRERECLTALTLGAPYSTELRV